MGTLEQRRNTTRRQFVKNMSAAAVAATGVLGASELLGAECRLVNRVVPYPMNIMPDACVKGGVIIEAPATTYLSFKAISNDLNEVGTAVIELKNCLATRFRYPGGHPKVNDGFLSDSLEPCQVFEVIESTWLRRVSTTLARGDRRAATARHFVFTFTETSVECLASDLKIDVWTQPFFVISAALSPTY